MKRQSFTSINNLHGYLLLFNSPKCILSLRHNIFSFLEHLLSCLVSSSSQCRVAKAHRFEEILELVLDVFWLQVFDPLNEVSLFDAAVALEYDRVDM